jgi:glycosyltransferase involved in cell wall biosynthesis
MKVAHVITRMIIGGAQENTLYNCVDLIQYYSDDVLLMTGPSQGPEGRLLEQGRGEGVPVREIPHLRRSIQPVDDWQAYRELIRAMREFKPDVVHTHSAKGGLLGRAAAWKLKVPAVIHTVHGAPFHPYQPWLVRKFFAACERWAAKRCHRMVCVADAMTELMVGEGVAPREKFTTVYSGMDVEPFLHAAEHRSKIRSELNLPQDAIVIGKIARLFHLKGHEYVIEAASEVVRCHPKVMFLFVGDGILRGELELAIRAKGLQEHFCFAGLVPPQRIPEYLGAMDILVHTSLREGLARALPQALISGIPVVSFDVDGAREVVLSGQTGFLLPPKDVAGVGRGLRELVLDEGLRKKCGETGREMFTDRFRHQKMTADLRQIYAEVLSKSGKE